MKTKIIEKIEKKMEELDEKSIRYKILKDAKTFKTSWIDLGQTLHEAWKNKMYKEWGFEEFDAYLKKEVGIRKETALKLLRSYSFLEREEPSYLKKEDNDQKKTTAIPSYESVDVLRKAKQKEALTDSEYGVIRKYVLEEGKDEKQIKKDISEMLKQKAEDSPEEARKKKHIIILRRTISSLKSLKRELSLTKMLPEKILRDIESIMAEIEGRIE